MILFLLFEHACVCIYTDLEKHLPVCIAIVAIIMGLGRWLRTWHACLTSIKAWMWAPRTDVKLDIVAHIYNLHVPTSRWGTKTWEHHIPLAWNPWPWATEDTVGNGVKDGGGLWGFLLISSPTCTHALKHGWTSTTHTQRFEKYLWRLCMPLCVCLCVWACTVALTQMICQNLIDFDSACAEDALSSCNWCGTHKAKQMSMHYTNQHLGSQRR